MGVILGALVVAGFIALAVWSMRDPIRSERTEPVAPRERNTLSPWAIVAALLLPIVGFVIAIVLLAQGRGAHGAAVLLTTVVGAFIGAAIWL